MKTVIVMGLALTLLPAQAALATDQEAVGANAYTAPRNAFGQPDLSGSWSNGTLTPIVRQAQFGARGYYTDQEVNVIEGRAAAMADAGDAATDISNVRVVASEDVGGYNRGWLDPGSSVMRVGGQPRNSILTTPEGQYPPRKDGTPTGGDSPAASQGSTTAQYALYLSGTYDNPETRSLGERCLASFGRNGPPPMLSNGLYNNNYQIVQSGNAVAINIEMVHDTRIIRIGDQHRTDGVREWFGDSIGHYEGDTLVVETINLPATQAYMGAWQNLKVTERFTRTAPDRILYQFTVEDPTIWDQPWGGEYEFGALDGRVMEYACHEGNYAMENIMAGARQEDARRASGE